MRTTSANNQSPSLEKQQSPRWQIMNTWPRLRAVRTHPASMLSAFLIVICIALGFDNSAFFTHANWLAIGAAISVFGIAATGQTMVIVSGGVDLSTESVIALTSVIVAKELAAGLPLGTVIVLAVAIGAVVGVVNGLAISVLGVNSVIATLGSYSFVRGLAGVYSSDTSVTITNAGFLKFGIENVFGIPATVVVMLGCVVFGAVVLNYSRFGRNAYLMGDNVVAARNAGLRVTAMQIQLYALSALFSAIAGVVFASQVGAGLPDGALGYSLIVIAAVILGGASLAGGIGTIGGTVIGVLTLGVINDGLVILNLNNDWQAVATGVILVVAVALDRLRGRA
jgi:ribose transport system permease protein